MKLEEIYRRVEDSAQRLSRHHGERLRCGRGCCDCCVDELTVFEVEALYIGSRYAELLQEETPRPEGACAFLDSKGDCRIYDARPYVCRTQGLPLRWIHETPEGDFILLGILVISGLKNTELLPDQQKALKVLTTRAGLALRDRITQAQIFNAMESLSPQVAYIQKLSVAGRYDRDAVLADTTATLAQNMDLWVKDALTHYWGGPHLTENPLMHLQVVQSRVREGMENPANALRSVLRDAVEMLRPEGERKFTNEWILYNLLVMKYLEAKKVKEIANKLAISEADLFRKQKIAISETGKMILSMEETAISS